MFKRNQLLVMAFTFVLLAGSVGLRPLSAKGSAEDERERVQKATTVLSEIMGVTDGGIPKDLMNRAEAVAVIPHMVKGAFIVGGDYGKGVVSRRMNNGSWSAPAFLKMGGGSFGFQLGAEATDLVLIFTNRDGVDGLIKGKVKLGADASVAAGPVGRNAQVGTDVLLNSAVLAYSRAKGLFAGIALDGAVVSIDNDANRKVYGHELTADDILNSGRAKTNDIVMPFVHELEKDAPQAKRTTD